MWQLYNINTPDQTCIIRDGCMTGNGGGKLALKKISSLYHRLIEKWDQISSTRFERYIIISYHIHESPSIRSHIPPLSTPQVLNLWNFIKAKDLQGLNARWMHVPFFLWCLLMFNNERRPCWTKYGPTTISLKLRTSRDGFDALILVWKRLLRIKRLIRGDLACHYCMNSEDRSIGIQGATQIGSCAGEVLYPMAISMSCWGLQPWKVSVTWSQLHYITSRGEHFKKQCQHFRIIWNQFICQHEHDWSSNWASAVSGVARRQWRKWRLPKPILRWKTKLLRVPWN